MQITLTIPSNMQEALEIIASRRGMSIENVCMLFIDRELGNAQDDAYRRAMQAARDQGYPGSFADYLKEHPRCCIEELR